MGNTYTVGGGSISVVPDGTDIDVVACNITHFPIGEMRLLGINFDASAASDRIVVRHSSYAGSIMFSGDDLVGGGLTEYPGVFCRPYVTATNCVFGTTANVIITFTFDQS